MPSFQHIVPPIRVFCGDDCFRFLERELERAGSRSAVIVCGSSLGRHRPIIDLITEAAGGRCAGVFSGVRPHSPVLSVKAAVEELRRFDADAVIALGGGSAIVSARAAAIVMAESAPIDELCTWRTPEGKLISPKLLAPKIPQFVVPSTPTTAAVKAGTAVFDAESGRRLAMFDPKTRAQALFVHPTIIGTAPEYLLSNACLNTFVSAIEGLTTASYDPLADASLMHAVRLLKRHLLQHEALGIPATRIELMLAAVLCGQGTDYTGVGLTTVLGHALGVLSGVDNGVVKSILLPHVLRFNAEATGAGLAKLNEAMGAGGTGEDGDPTGAIEAVFQALNVPRRLQDIGVPMEALEEVAEASMGDWFLKGNPRPVRSAADIVPVLRNAW
jgi:alcohol dehydrogenase